MSQIIKGICKIIQDSKGNDYFAVDVSKEYYLAYEKFMLNNGFNEEVNLKLKRDHGNYHITIINAMQWGSLKKKDLLEPILTQLNERELSFSVEGIGKAQKDSNCTYFVVLENQQLTAIREQLSLGKHDFHMTLGFKEKDVFGVPKDVTSIVFSKENIFPKSKSLKF